MLWVRIETSAPAAHRAVQIDTGNNTLLKERGSATIVIRLPNDPQRTTFALRLIVCAEVNKNLPATDPSYLGIPGNPQMAVLPMYNEYCEAAMVPVSTLTDLGFGPPSATTLELSPHINKETGYFLGKPTKYAAPDPIPLNSVPPYYPQLVNQSYVDGNMAIARFNATDWPAAADNVSKMISEVLIRMMNHIASRE
jgi:hypothetical protein